MVSVRSVVRFLRFVSQSAVKTLLLGYLIFVRVGADGRPPLKKHHTLILSNYKNRLCFVHNLFEIKIRFPYGTFVGHGV